MGSHQAAMHRAGSKWGEHLNNRIPGVMYLWRFNNPVFDFEKYESRCSHERGQHKSADSLTVGLKGAP